MLDILDDRRARFKALHDKLQADLRSSDTERQAAAETHRAAYEAADASRKAALDRCDNLDGAAIAEFETLWSAETIGLHAAIDERLRLVTGALAGEVAAG